MSSQNSNPDPQPESQADQGKTSHANAAVRRAYVLLVAALVVSSLSMAGHFLQPMGSWWRASDDGQLLYTGIRPPIWKTYNFDPLEIEAMGIMPDPESPGGEVFAVAAGGMTLKLVDLNAQAVPGFEAYVSDVKRLAMALKEGRVAPPVMWVHWLNVAVALGVLISVILWLLAFIAIIRVRPGAAD